MLKSLFSLSCQFIKFLILISTNKNFCLVQPAMVCLHTLCSAALVNGSKKNKISFHQPDLDMYYKDVTLALWTLLLSYWSILKFEFLQTDMTTKRDFSTWHFFKKEAVLFLFFEKLFDQQCFVFTKFKCWQLLARSSQSFWNPF